MVKLEKQNKPLSLRAFAVDLMKLYITNNDIKKSIFGKSEKKEKASLIVDVLNWCGL